MHFLGCFLSRNKKNHWKTALFPCSTGSYLAGVSPSGKAEDSDSSISWVRILPPQPKKLAPSSRCFFCAGLVGVCDCTRIAFCNFIRTVFVCLMECKTLRQTKYTRFTRIDESYHPSHFKPKSNHSV